MLLMARFDLQGGIINSNTRLKLTYLLYVPRYTNETPLYIYILTHFHWWDHLQFLDGFGWSRLPTGSISFMVEVSLIEASNEMNSQ